MDLSVVKGEKVVLITGKYEGCQAWLDNSHEETKYSWPVIAAVPRPSAKGRSHGHVLRLTNLRKTSIKLKKQTKDQ